VEALPVSVIVVVKNAKRTIEDCLSSIQSNNPAEIIVIDGNSSDGTTELAKKYTKCIHSDEGRGLTYARQLGAEKTTQEYISYVDSDIVLPSGTLATMLQEFKASGYATISAQIKTGRSLTYWEWAMHEHIQIIFSRGNILGLAASLLRRDLILKYGFDTRFPLLDDSDLFRRLYTDGHRFSVSSAFAYHHHKADLKGFVKQRFVNGRGKAQFLWKYGLLNLTAWPPLIVMYMLGFSLIKGKTNLIPYFLLGGIIETGGVVKGFFELIRNKFRAKRK